MGMGSKLESKIGMVPARRSSVTIPFSQLLLGRFGGAEERLLGVALGLI